MLHAAAWQHEAAAAIQRQMRGYRATPAESHPTTGWRSSPEAEVRNARLVQDNRDLKAANEELRTKLQTELLGGSIEVNSPWTAEHAGAECTPGVALQPQTALRICCSPHAPPPPRRRSPRRAAGRRG